VKPCPYGVSTSGGQTPEIVWGQTADFLGKWGYLGKALNHQKWRYSYGRQCYQNKISKVVIHLPVNAAALASPGGGFGNVGRNVLRGPRQVRFDMALSKRTQITEAVGFELRGEVFNLFNNTNFVQPVGDLADSEFGQITNTIGGPRTMQLGMRFTF